MADPLISIVVPVYNVGIYLEECIRSIRAQAYSNLEILLVDDGSTDGSSGICDRHARADRRIRAVHQANAGPGMARNRGIEESKGEFIAFVDGDDIASEDYISQMYALCARHPGHIAAGQSVCFKDGERPAFSCRGREKTGAWTAEQALMRCMYQDPLMETSVWGRLFPAALFREGGIRFPNAYYEDLGTLYKLLARSPGIACTTRKIYGYRQRNSGTMRGGFTEKKGRDILRVTERLLEDFSGAPDGLFRAARCRCFCAVCNVYMTIPKGEFPGMAEALWSEILRLRKGVALCRGARMKARFGALATRLGSSGMKALYGAMNRTNGG